MMPFWVYVGGFLVAWYLTGAMIFSHFQSIGHACLAVDGFSGVVVGFVSAAVWPVYLAAAYLARDIAQHGWRKRIQ